jgi:hypothetical protein
MSDEWFQDGRLPMKVCDLFYLFSFFLFSHLLLLSRLFWRWASPFLVLLGVHLLWEMGYQEKGETR